jgi:hypothetical protein
MDAQKQLVWRSRGGASRQSSLPTVLSGNPALSGFRRVLESWLFLWLFWVVLRNSAGRAPQPAIKIWQITPDAKWVYLKKQICKKNEKTHLT